MKITFILLALFINVCVVNAQNCDVAQTGVAIFNSTNSSPIATIPVGQNANFKFSIANFGSDLGCTIPVNSVTAVFDFPTLANGTKPYVYDGAASFTSGFFTWTYDAAENVLVGVNTTAIPNGAGDLNVMVKVKGNASGAGSSNLNLTQGAGVSDNTANNFSGAQLIISAAGPLPVKLTAFNGTAKGCEAALTWATESETNFSSFEVEYSADGTNFSKIGSVAGKNSATGSSYKFDYAAPGGNGFYRLKMLDKDGRFTYTPTVKVVINCLGNAIVTVFPNPVISHQKLVVKIAGYTGRVNGELFNASGQKVAVYSLNNTVNELSVAQFSAGVYSLHVIAENKDVQTFKVTITR